jgi:AAA domain (dynein-related subfamily)
MAKSQGTDVDEPRGDRHPADGDRDEVKMHVTLSPDDGSAERSFVDPDMAWRPADKLLDDERFRRVLVNRLGPGVLPSDPNKLKKTLKQAFFETQNVQWYWAEFFARIEDLPGPLSEAEARPGIEVALKACRDHRYYTLVAGRREQEQQFLHTPFFERIRAPAKTGEGPEMRGLADAVRFLAPRLLRLLKKKRFSDRQLERELDWFDVRCKLEVMRYERDERRMLLHLEWEVCEPNHTIRTPNGIEVLVVSPHVRRAIWSIAEAWLDPRVKCVLVSGGAGAGKEVLVDLFAAALMINDRRVNISASEAEKMPNVAQRLRSATGRLSLPKVRSPLSGAPGGERSLVFLDEIHHQAAEDVRAGLLRLLETDELPTEDGELVLDFRNVAYVLAASDTVAELRTRCSPADLWTRVEYVVEMLHPLEVGTDEERAEILSRYFDTFWNHHRSKWDACDVPLPARQKVWNLFGEPDGSDDDDRVKPVVREVFCALESPRPSMRELRTIVKRLFGRSVTYVRTRDIIDSGDEEKMKEFRAGLERACIEWMTQLSGELLPQHARL